jgi:hypothetical protein
LIGGRTPETHPRKTFSEIYKKVLDTAIPPWYNANTKIFAHKGDYPKW